jgi:hypothetical protein
VANREGLEAVGAWEDLGAQAEQAGIEAETPGAPERYLRVTEGMGAKEASADLAEEAGTAEMEGR